MSLVVSCSPTTSTEPSRVHEPVGELLHRSTEVGVARDRRPGILPDTSERADALNRSRWRAAEQPESGSHESIDDHWLPRPRTGIGFPLSSTCTVFTGPTPVSRMIAGSFSPVRAPSQCTVLATSVENVPA